MAFGAAAVPGAEDASSGDGEQVAEDRCGKPTVKASGNDQKHWCFGPHLYISCSKNHSSPKKGRFFPPPPGRGLEDCHLKMVDSWGLYGSMLVGGCWLVTRVSIYGKTTLHPLVDPHIPFRNGILRVVPHFQTDPI